jgi:hypothetical protein
LKKKKNRDNRDMMEEVPCIISSSPRETLRGLRDSVKEEIYEDMSESPTNTKELQLMRNKLGDE